MGVEFPNRLVAKTNTQHFDRRLPMAPRFSSMGHQHNNATSRNHSRKEESYRQNDLPFSRRHHNKFFPDDLATIRKLKLNRRQRKNTRPIFPKLFYAKFHAASSGLQNLCSICFFGKLSGLGDGECCCWSSFKRKWFGWIFDFKKYVSRGISLKKCA